MIIGMPDDKAARIGAIARGIGLQALLDELYSVLQNPIFIFDMEYKLIARSAITVDDDPICNEFLQNGRLGAETVEFFKDEGFIEEVSNSTMQDGITYLVSENLKYNRIFGQLFNQKHVPVADLVMVECESSFGKDTPELVKTACDLLSYELGRDDYYQEYGQIYKENIIRELLDGRITDTKIYAGHIANIDQNLKAHIHLAVADIARVEKSYSNLIYYRDLFRQTQPDFDYYVYNGYIVILMSRDNEKRFNEEADLRKLRGLFEQENIYVGISGCFENLFELRKYYADALEALKRGIKDEGAGRLFYTAD